MLHVSSVNVHHPIHGRVAPVSTYQAHTTGILPACRACPQFLAELGLVLAPICRLAIRADPQLVVNRALTAVRLQGDEWARERVGGRIRVAVERLALRENHRQPENEEQRDRGGREAQRPVHLGRDRLMQPGDESRGGDGSEEARDVVVGLMEDFANWSWQVLDEQLQERGRDGENWRRRARQRRHG